jgi:cell fate regulator YaaT (PSP1 superfamily)
MVLLLRNRMPSGIAWLCVKDRLTVSMFTADEREEMEGLAQDLAELRTLGKEIDDALAGYMTADFKDRIEKWLLKVQEVAKSYKAVDYTITLGVPLGVAVSFTWSPTKE